MNPILYKVIEFGEYDQRIEKLLNGKARYYESVDTRVKSNSELFKNEIEFYLKNYQLDNQEKTTREDKLSSINEIIKKNEKTYLYSMHR